MNNPNQSGDGTMTMANTYENAMRIIQDPLDNNIFKDNGDYDAYALEEIAAIKEWERDEAKAGHQIEAFEDPWIGKFGGTYNQQRFG